MDEFITYNAYVWNIFGGWIGREIMSKVREDCFWHRSFRDYNNFTDAFETMHECYLAEPWTCPCTQDCDWFVQDEKVRNHIYMLQLKSKEI